jgi:hypothetical protein
MYILFFIIILKLKADRHVLQKSATHWSRTTFTEGPVMDFVELGAVWQAMANSCSH